MVQWLLVLVFSSVKTLTGATPSMTNHVITRNVDVAQFDLTQAIEKRGLLEMMITHSGTEDFEVNIKRLQNSPRFNAQKVHYFHNHIEEKRCSPVNLLVSTGVFSETICSQLCLNQPGCHNALYDIKKKHCHLFTNQPSKYLKIVDSSPYVYIEDHCSHSFSNGETEGLYNGCPPVESEVSYRDCHDVFQSGNTEDGIYTLNIDGNYTRVYCTPYEGSGYTVILRRDERPRFSFFRSYREAIVGVGVLSSDYFIGLEALHQLTHMEASEDNEKLIVLLKDGDGSWKNATYTMTVQGQHTGYELTVGGWASDFPDTEGALEYHSGQKFTTWDMDQDAHSIGNCALHYPGMWWFSACHNTVPTGKYKYSSEETGTGVGDGFPWYHSKSNTWKRYMSVIYMISHA